MEDKGIARLPGAFGRIPNFIGAEKVAFIASELEIFKKAKVVKFNPDSPQKKLREIALKQGKIVYMAVPRLTDEKCFVMIDPDSIDGRWGEASTIKGAFRLGKKVHPREMKKIDLMVAGSVAVNLSGQRIGKGGGFSDLEFAILRTFNLIDDTNPIITTVHQIQILHENFSWEKHDIPLDFIVTPEETFETHSAFPKPEGIFWDFLTDEQIECIPILRKLKDERFKV